MGNTEKKVLALRLDAPLQAWCTDASFFGRKTEAWPSRSAVWGLICNAAGWYGSQKERLTRVADLPVTVLGCQSPNLPVLRDFQTIGSGYNEDEPWEDFMIPHRTDGQRPAGNSAARILVKEYVMDSVFGAFVTVPAEWADELARALQDPVGSPYLGRKCCIPAAPIFIGVYDAEDEAIEAFRTEMKERGRIPQFEVRECGKYDPDARVISDVPVEFGSKRKWRHRAVVVRTLAEL